MRRMRQQGGKGGYQYHDRRVPGMAGEPPSSRERTQPGELAPQTVAARIAGQIIHDPWAREELGLFLEEAFRNFQLHQLPPPWIFPPYSAIVGSGGGMIFELGEIAPLSAGAGFTDLVTGDVPAGAIAWLRKFGHGITAAGGYDDIHWRIARRGLGASSGDASERGLPPFADITHLIGQIDLPTDIYVPIRGPATWAVQARNASGSTDYTIGARIDGWWYAPRVMTETASGAMVD